MADQYGGTFAALGTLAQTGYDAGSVTAIQAAITSIRGLFMPAAGQSCAHPDFDHAPQAFKAKLDAELAALSAAITVHA